MTNLEPIYICLVSPISRYDSFLNIVEIINKQFPNNLLTIKQYLTDFSLENLLSIFQDFINTYPSGKRISIITSTAGLKISSEFFNRYGISSIGVGATSPLVKTFTNVLTYAPNDKYSVMSQFLIYKDYQMKQIKILYQRNSNFDIFFGTYRDLVVKQADLLGINVEIEFFEQGKNDYNIKPKSLIIILAITAAISTLYITNDFLNNIPPECYITLTDVNTDIKDIFGNIPTMILSPYPIDYTETSAFVYSNLTNKNYNIYSSYVLYDILYTLVFFTGVNLPLTIENILKINPFQSGVSPSFIGAQSNFNPEINGYDFGVYQAVFTKNSVINNNIDLFEKYNQGGTLSLPNSNSIFKTLGIVPFFNVNIFYGDEDYYKIYDECGNLIVTRFASNITDFPIKQNSKINIAQHVENKFYCKYTTDGYFSYLEKVFNVFGPNPQVNITMGKQSVNKVFVLN